MAVADPLPPAFMPVSSPAMQGPSPTSAFSRFSQLRRAEAPTNFQPPFTLEGIALYLDRASPTEDLAYLTEGYYSPADSFRPVVRTNGEVSSRQPMRKSLSFPKMKRDTPLKSCVLNEKYLRRAKSVRFADTQGLPLIEAIHQLKVGDSSYTENKIVPYNENCEFQPVELVSCRQSKAAKDKQHSTTTATNTTSPYAVPTARMAAAKMAQIPALTLSPSTASPVVRPPQLSPPIQRRVFRFSQPGSEPGFYERVSRDNVVLESVRDEPRMIRGVIRVANISYHKEVTVRWSHDHWRSYHDTNAVFSANDGHTDRFTFELPANGEDIEFALRFKCDGAEYWDSNRGKNYIVEGVR